MNKLTLSVAAMAVIAGSAQAAEPTDATLAYQSLTQGISKAILALEQGDYHAAVKEEYQTMLSALQKRVDDAMGKGTLAAEAEALQTELNECVTGAEKAEKPWDAKDGLIAYYASKLDEALADAAKVMKNDFNADFIKATKDAYDKDVKESNDIKSDIDNFDVKDVTGYAATEEALKGRIDALKEKLKRYNNQLITDNGIYVENKAANEKFETAYGKAGEAYNDAIDQISGILSTDAYAAMRQEALGKLNTAYQGKVMKAYKENALKDGKNTITDVNTLVNDYLEPAKTEFANIVKAYTATFNRLEAYYTQGSADIKTLNERLKKTTDVLEKYKGETYGLDQQTEKVNEINTMIEGLQNIVDNYITNDGKDYSAEKTAIEGKLTALETATSAGIANAKAYETALADIKTLESNLTTAIAEAQKVSYADGEFTYKPAEYFTTTAISELIDKDDKENPGLKQYWAKLYKEGKAVGNTVDGTDVTNAIDKYTKDIDAAKTAYEKAANKRNERAGLVESLKDLDADVTLDGKADSKIGTYGSLKEAIQGEVDAIQKKLDEAKGLKNAEHAKKINEGANVSTGKTPEEVKKLVEDYSDVVNDKDEVISEGNKTKYYKSLNIAAAEKIIAQANTSVDNSSNAIGKLTVKGTGLDSDQQQKALQKVLDDINKGINEIKTVTIANTVTIFESDKAKYATEAIASLSPVIEKLNEYAQKIAELEKNIATQEANFKAYQELMKLNSFSTAYTLKEDIAGSITNAESKVKGATDESKLDASQKYYVGLLDGYKTDLKNLETEINNYYYAGTMVDNQATANNKVTDLKSKVEAVTTNYGLNNTNHKSQLGLASALQTLWNQTYTTISQNDQTSNKDAVLKNLDDQLQEIINFKKEINDAWSNGLSETKNKGFEDKKDLIENAINTIYTNWDGTNGWRKVLVDDNNKNHKVFMTAYEFAKAQFDAAIVSLEKFSKIKNADTKAVMNSEDLIDTHKKIYDYADKFRTLLEDEQEALNIANGTAEIDPTVFDAQQFIKNNTTGAEDYAKQILEKLNEYRSKVNSEAYKVHIECIKDAVKKVVLAEDAIKGYDETVKNTNYLKSAQDLIKPAQSAASLKAVTTDGVNVTFDGNQKDIDAEFAVKIDDYVNTSADKNVGRFASELDELVFTGKNNAADAQFAVLAKAIYDLYNTEVTDINSFAVADKVSYLTELQNLYADTYTAAKAEWDGLAASTDKVQYLAEWSNPLNEFSNPLNNYKASGKENSQTWINANNEHINNTADATAKTAVETLLRDANRSYTVIAGAINELYGPHCPVNRISTQLDVIANKLDEFKARNAEAGGHVALQDEVEKYTDGLTTVLATLQIDAIDFEFSQLGIEIDKVKEHYNKLVKATAADKLNDIKVYEETIGNYYKERDEKKTAWDKLTDEEKLGAFEKYKSGLIDFAAQIFATGNELIARYEDNKGTIEAEAVSAVQAEQTKVTEDLNKIAGMLDVYENDLKMYQEEYNSLTIKLNSIDNLFESYTGSISFYKDNLISDYQKLAVNVSDLNKKVEPEYTKCVTDTEIYNRLIGKFNDLNTQLETAKNEVKDYVDAADWYEYDYELISEAIVTNIETLDNRLTKLTFEDEKAYNSSCETLSGNIKTYEYHVKVEQTKIYQTEYESAYKNAKDAIEGKLYGATTQIEITNEKTRLFNAINNVSTYVTNAKIYGDGTGKVITDIISGEELADDEKKWLINFVSDAEGFDYIESTLCDLIKDAEALKSKAEEMAYIQGDADNDGVVTVNDYSEVRGWILSATKYEDVPEAKRLGGDVNVDGEFTVADMAGISNLIFHGEVKVTAAKVSARMRAAADATDQLTLTSESEETTIFGKTVRMALNVENAETFTAGQLDITLPQGMKIAAQSLSDRANGHELLANELGNGIVRMVASTVENNAFTGHNGALIYIDVEVGSDYNGGQIAIDNVIFSDAKANSYYLSKNAPILPTGVEGIQAATMKERIYSVGGQMLKAVKKGVNIIKGENGTKKVISNK